MTRTTTCAHVNRWLQLYLDGRLTPRHQTSLVVHLRACAACRAELRLLEAICQGAGETVELEDPAALTRAVMNRVALFEARRAAVGAQSGFAFGWADAALAGGLATLATAMLLFVQPALRQMFLLAVAQDLTPAGHAVALLVGGWAGWAVWAVWVGVGVMLTLWFAGGEVRAGWRRTLQSWQTWLPR